MLKTGEKHLHVFCGHLVKAMSQPSHKIFISTQQQAADLFRDPSIVEQALCGGGRERRGQGQLVQHCMNDAIRNVMLGGKIRSEENGIFI